MVRTCAAPGCRIGYPLKKDFKNSYSGLCNGVPSDVTALQTVNKHLRPGAVPVLWPGCPEYLSKKEKPKRKSPKERVLPSPKATIFDSESEEPYYFKREIVAGGHVCIWKQTWLPAAKAILKHQANGSNEMSTTTTFLQLFRMIALYYPGKKILRGANIDDESDLNSGERLTVLTNYHDWIKGEREQEEARCISKILKGFIIGRSYRRS
ncbi:hypothetical protein OUZ56_026591 [Daphnia magna]|uniref:Uncharacterized protein n=1 Tax=Daphnia magna TaxID=35525 RepID=A0ABQ9ZM77_9CRUS|nr:hypothetical protein OUZ56_026591 [Daphnia magna]